MIKTALTILWLFALGLVAWVIGVGLYNLEVTSCIIVMLAVLIIATILKPWKTIEPPY